ncbi:uncharacterized protein LACBIDRAFT_326191 [Laccaria bicolor S238N-H82]|uniref:Predicted protein n=1 Tax=Laccaria bicolor (strain S238N-H82 / ATCC MYA-4686) TaxID=486041 RepID=B0D7L0_LACBS|nr:uncharacterized protein LACBIDRAFT_326191 [Laccaria bicolor S238N-H82]EDR09669.1 predicted protein [Laccaria bicolor S238N-H82]|eukprot:XP_001880018.1 predicted protein [Laccaria bicolor S238N-H82]
MSQPANQDRRGCNNSIFPGICQKFPNIAETVVMSMIFHDFSALDLYNLPMQFGAATPPRLPHQTPRPQSFLEPAITWSREPNLVFRHLFTYFSVLSTYFCNQPTIPLGFFRYLGHLQYLSGLHEWTRVHEYHIEFFNNRILEMRHGDFSKWANPDTSLMKKYGFDQEKVLPEPNQYAANRIFYNGKVWGLVNDPSRAAINCIIRRTRDPYAEKIQYVAQYKATTDRLDMSHMPFGKPGQRFQESKRVLPILRSVWEDFEVLKNRKKEEEAKVAAEKAQRRSQRIAHFKALLPRAGCFLSLPRRFYRGKEKPTSQSDLQEHDE